MSIWVRDTDEYRRALAEERLVVAASELTSEALERRGRTRTWLAQQLGVRLPEISQRLSGRRNLTLRSFAAMLHELDYDLEVRLVERRPAAAGGVLADPETSVGPGDEPEVSAAAGEPSGAASSEGAAHSKGRGAG